MKKILTLGLIFLFLLGNPSILLAEETPKPEPASPVETGPSPEPIVPAETNPPSGPASPAEASPPPKVTTPIESTRTDPVANGKMDTKSTYLANGDIYWMKRIHFNKKLKASYKMSFVIPGKSGTFKYVEDIKGVKKWRTVPLTGTLPKYVGFISTDQYHMIVSHPTTYITGKQNTITQSSSSTPITVTANKNGGYTLVIEFAQTPGTWNEIWGLESTEPLIDWEKPPMEAVWLYYDLDIERKWSWDGFYVKTPASYSPTGKNMFWRIPANAVALSFVRTGGSRAAEDLGWIMLRVSIAHQNKDGYWETGPRSQWLWKDYGVKEGFFDTRFNTDMGLAMLYGYRMYEEEEFIRSAERYANWLIKHAQKEHWTVQKEGQEGWLVADYGQQAPHKRVHASLNHQLAELNYLYEMFMETQQEAYRVYADKLLYGIKNTASLWIKPDGDLHYAYENGKGIKPDYPYLTYNDLWETQRILKTLNGEVDPDLTKLMESKKKFMDKHKIKGYNPRPL
ncbi:hypothetical protein [Aneurinibacillus tyrosinisolvens]|uniref:hypothetical protein n=1 Tax=Aneurinibacillus tyrosinisolvens TaxID=1443435 RepID=UPI00069AFDD6|nr:hypothetical protein [Aneurinibacillus tyrosinisolvens]